MSDETETVIAAAVGLTVKQAAALDAITVFVGRHGVMPSRRQLAAELGCGVDNAQQLITRLIERRHLSTLTAGGQLSGFGQDGVAVFVPAHLAAQLAAFCAARSERVTAVVADAIALHLDQLEALADEDAAEVGGA